ncbi:MAG: glycosyltransferase family 39 protein [Candidatus Shapirobacteria bacterium]|nr:glycosyltransferase family 39 protein [Candidatus Shapirobacteria bacterium]
MLNILKNIKFNGRYLVFGVLFLFLLILKFHNYDRVPDSAHAEELLYSWSGINLIETGVPMSWSTLDYSKENLMFDGIVGDLKGVYLPAKLYKPWLDEPPLFSLMSGGVAHLFGDDRDKLIPTSHSRIPTVLASVVTMFLVFWVGYKFYSFNVGILAMCFYGITPIIVFGSRMSVPENIIALAVTASLLLMKSYMRKPKLFYAFIFGIFSMLLGLMKPTGFFLAPLCIYFAVKNKRWKDILIITGFVILGIGLYILYGYMYDWELFKSIVAIQGGRFAGWTGLAYVLNSPSFDIFTLFDGWYVFGLFFALFFSFQKKMGKNTKLLSMFFFYWLVMSVISGSEQDLLPWYRYPFFPMLSIFGSLGLVWVYKRANFFTMVFAVGLLLSSRYYLANDFRPTTPPNVYRIVYFIALIPSLLSFLNKSTLAKKISRWILIVFVILGFYFNAKYIYSAFEIRCENKTCPFSQSTLLSKTKLPFFDRFLLPKYPATDMLTTKRPWF